MLPTARSTYHYLCYQLHAVRITTTELLHVRQGHTNLSVNIVKGRTRKSWKIKEILLTRTRLMKKRTYLTKVILSSVNVRAKKGGVL